MNDHVKPIGPVPVVIPPNAKPDDAEEMVAFKVDHSDPDQIAWAKEVGWGRLYQLQRDEEKALKERENS